MDHVAEDYVKLALAVGEHDENYVDAYYGPEEWRKQEKQSKRSLDQIIQAAKLLQDQIKSIDVARSEDGQLRRQYLTQQIQSLEARVRLLRGEKFSFDSEAQAIYGVTPPKLSDEHFSNVVVQISELLPGDGDLPSRYERFMKKYVIPTKKLAQIMELAIEECRKRTKSFLPLPPSETFKVEYVSARPWGAYNWYKGKYFSLIQINTEREIYVNGPVGTAAHEGYPGHHVYNALLEKNYLRERKWMEFSVYPLFSPQSLVAEGSANYGIDLLFDSPADRQAFEKKHVFPAAGVDAADADRFYALQRFTDQLNYASNEAARAYLDGKRSKEETVEWLIAHAMQTRDRAKRQVDFIDQYRSYVINYNYGEDLVRKYVESRVGKNAAREKRWQAFIELISSPRLLTD